MNWTIRFGTAMRGVCLICAATCAHVAYAADTGEIETPAGAADMPTVVPSKQEKAGSVFAKLDSGKKGYIALADVTVLPGFDRVFQRADANHDGKLTMPEFKVAWSAYTGNADTGEAPK